MNIWGKVEKKYKQMIYPKRFGKEYEMLVRQYKKGRISEKEYEDKKTKIEQEYYSNISDAEHKQDLIEKFHLFAPNYGGTGDVVNPKTYNEKIQWLKLNDSTELKTKLSDKYAVRFWVEEKIGKQYLIPMLGVWDRAGDIDFEQLPKQFVLKTNHASGTNIIVKDKDTIDKKKIVQKLDEWMQVTYGHEWYEKQYIDIEKKIIAEEYIEQMDGGLYDYKFHCFNGEPRYIHVLGERSEHGGKEAFYDTLWVKQNFVCGAYPMFDKEIKKPSKFEEMLELSKQLSKDFLYVRVDFYQIKDEIKFGEMTFTPYAGIYKWNPPETNVLFGELLQLPFEGKED